MNFIAKGDVPMSGEQLNRRTQAYINRDWPEWKRERSIRLADGKFDTYMVGISANDDANRAANSFNGSLVAYKNAVARLERYVLAEGQDELIEDIPTGEQEFDEVSGQMVDVTLATVTKQFIEPLPATVEDTTYDENGDPVVSTIYKRLIVQDAAERLSAQATINSTNQEVIDWVAAESA